MKASLLFTVAALLASVAPVARAAEALPETGSQSTEGGPYADGMRALNQQRWPDAVAAFSRVAEAHGRRSDAALYWKAYSLNKLGQTSLANATCAQLQVAYRASTWNHDCVALTMSLQPGQNELPGLAEVRQLQEEVKDIHVVVPELHIDALHRERADPDADLKILALNSLMNRDPAQALPLLRNLLAGNQPDGVKQHAIFVLGQNNSPEAQQLTHDLILGRVDPNLQIEAIHMTATQGRRANDSLEEAYRSTSNPQVKEAVTSALFVSGDAPRLVRLARDEKNLSQKRDIVSKLALMQDKAATDYMLELLK